MLKLTRRQAGAIAGASILLPRFGKAAEINWKFTSSQPATHPSTIRYMEAAERVKQKSNGRFEITVFHSGQLGTDLDTFTQVRIGGVQMMVLSNLLTATAAPLGSLPSMPFALKDYNAVWQAMDGKLGKLLRADLEKAGYLTTDKILDSGFHQMTSSSKPINTVADMQGFKLRAPPSPLIVSTWRAIGAAPTSMNFSELYTALQTGVVEGQEGPLVYIRTNRLFEVQKYLSLTSHIWDGWYTLINPRAFSRLPKDMQDLVMDSFNQAGVDVRNDMVGLLEQTKGFLAEKGMIVSTPPDLAPFRQKLKDAGLYKEWKEKMGPEGWALLRGDQRPVDPDTMDTTTSQHVPALHGPVAATARAIERPLMRCLELIAAALVAADIAILLIGVIARYVFRSPLIWTDELAQAVFLWLGMIGATVALNRGEHMRMTALIVRAAPGPRHGLEAFAAAAGLVFLAAVHPARRSNTSRRWRGSRCRASASPRPG